MYVKSQFQCKHCGRKHIDSVDYLVDSVKGKARKEKMLLMPKIPQARIQTTATFALANLEKFCYWKIGETLRKIGETLDKIRKLGNFKEVHFFSCIRACTASAVFEETLVNANEKGNKEKTKKVSAKKRKVDDKMIKMIGTRTRQYCSSNS